MQLTPRFKILKDDITFDGELFYKSGRKEVEVRFSNLINVKDLLSSFYLPEVYSNTLLVPSNTPEPWTCPVNIEFPPNA